LSAGLWQVFAENLTVKIIRSIEYALVNWFGDITIDIGSVLLKAIYSCSPYGIPINLPPGKFPATTPIHYLQGIDDINVRIRIQGAGRASARNGYDGFINTN
jgi:hypothetical protein